MRRRKKRKRRRRRGGGGRGGGGGKEGRKEGGRGRRTSDVVPSIGQGGALLTHVAAISIPLQKGKLLTSRKIENRNK